MSPEECAKQVIKESLELDGSIDENALMRVVAQVCGKPTSVSLSDVSASSLPVNTSGSLTKSDRRRSMGGARRASRAGLSTRSVSLQLDRSAGPREHRTSRPKSAKQEEQALFESLRREVADARTLADLEDTIDHVTETLDDGATRIPREISRLEGLLKKAENRLRKDPHLKE